MTQTMYLVSKSAPQLGARVVNGVIKVIVNATSQADALLNAALAANAAFKPTTSTDDSESDFYQAEVLFSPTYFDTAVAISAAGGEPASGNGSVQGDAYVFPEPATPYVYVDHSAYTPV